MTSDTIEVKRTFVHVQFRKFMQVIHMYVFTHVNNIAIEHLRTYYIGTSEKTAKVTAILLNMIRSQGVFCVHRTTSD